VRLIVARTTPLSAPSTSWDTYAHVHKRDVMLFAALDDNFLRRPVMDGQEHERHVIEEPHGGFVEQDGVGDHAAASCTGVANIRPRRLTPASPRRRGRFGAVLERYRDRTGNALIWCLAGNMGGIS
jgi:hypothetical protein